MKLGSYTDNRTVAWVGERGLDKDDPIKEQYMVLHRVCSVAINNRHGGRIFHMVLEIYKIIDTWSIGSNITRKWRAIYTWNPLKWLWKTTEGPLQTETYSHKKQNCTCLEYISYWDGHSCPRVPWCFANLVFSLATIW